MDTSTATVPATNRGRLAIGGIIGAILLVCLILPLLHYLHFNRMFAEIGLEVASPFMWIATIVPWAWPAIGAVMLLGLYDNEKNARINRIAFRISLLAGTMLLLLVMGVGAFLPMFELTDVVAR